MGPGGIGVGATGPLPGVGVAVGDTVGPGVGEGGVFVGPTMGGAPGASWPAHATSVRTAANATAVALPAEDGRTLFSRVHRDARDDDGSQERSDRHGRDRPADRLVPIAARGLSHVMHAGREGSLDHAR